MKFFRFTSKIRDWLRGNLRSQHNTPPSRGQRTHVIILDGTMSSLQEGMETNAGQSFRLISESTAGVDVFYEAGLQFTRWRDAPDIMMGRGLNQQIRRAYGYLASHYHPGDRIFLLGYSRGAFAVRSLAGIIDRVGLLTANQTTVRNVRQAFRHYESDPEAEVAKVFAGEFCHQNVKIEMIGVWDTVKALGIRLPFFSRWSDRSHAFHDHSIGCCVQAGYHALALDERRVSYEPIMWETNEDIAGKIEQVWFRGTHGDVGGQIQGSAAVRPLSNIPLVWMLEKIEAHGLELPSEWRSRFPTNVNAPSIGNWKGWGKMFLYRRPRKIGRDPSEHIHESLNQRESASRRFGRRAKAS